MGGLFGRGKQHKRGVVAPDMFTIIMFSKLYRILLSVRVDVSEYLTADACSFCKFVGLHNVVCLYHI